MPMSVMGLPVVALLVDTMLAVGALSAAAIVVVVV